MPFSDLADLVIACARECRICRIVAVLCSVEFDGEGVRRTHRNLA